VGTWISARVRVYVVAMPARRMVSVTFVPSGPSTRAVSCSAVNPFVSVSPTFVITSPFCNPAAAAGEPGTVAVIVGYPAPKLRYTPMPEYLPW
jgi:hypothetical protein